MRIEEIFVRYNTSVIDVREFDRNAILNATDVTVNKIARPQLTDSKLKIVQVFKDETKVGETNSTVPQLPRVSITDRGDIRTDIVDMSDSMFIIKDEKPVILEPPMPFVKGLDAKGTLKIGFN